MDLFVVGELIDWNHELRVLYVHKYLCNILNEWMYIIYKWGAQSRILLYAMPRCELWMDGRGWVRLTVCFVWFVNVLFICCPLLTSSSPWKYYCHLTVFTQDENAQRFSCELVNFFFLSPCLLPILPRNVKKCVYFWRSNCLRLGMCVRVWNKIAKCEICALFIIRFVIIITNTFDTTDGSCLDL